MALGVEYGAKYTLTGPDGTVAVFNDSTDPNYVGILSPESSGLDSPDVREDAQERTEDDGGIHGNFYYGRRPVVLQGTIIATSAVQRNERAEKLTRASNAMRSDATLKWKPAGATEEVQLTLRRQQPLRITKGFTKEFQVSLVAADARIYSATKIEGKAASETTGYKTSSTWSSVVEGGGPVAWTTPANASASDNAYATVALASTQKSQVLVGKGFGFAIPASASVVGWGASIEEKANEASSFFNETIKHLNASGAVTGTGYLTGPVLGTSDVTNQSSFSGSDGITPTIANNANFGISLLLENTSAGARTYSLDQMRMQLTYVVPIINATNAGDIETFPIIEITGPITGPISITNKTTGKTLKINYTLPTLAVLKIDTGNRTITSGAVNLYSKLLFTESSWWGLAPGANEIEFSTTGASGATEFAVSYRNAWI